MAQDFAQLFSLHERTAFVTGASSVLGVTFAEAASSTAISSTTTTNSGVAEKTGPPT